MMNAYAFTDLLCNVFVSSKAKFYNFFEFVTLLCLVDLGRNVFPTLRFLRVLRAAKFVRRLSLLRRILSLIRTSFGYLLSLLFLQILFWLAFTFAGRQLFGSIFQVNSVLEPCGLYSDKATCHQDPSTQHCVWVNQTEWMTWNNTYMAWYRQDLIPSHSLSQSGSPMFSGSYHSSMTHSRDVLSASHSFSNEASKSMTLPNDTIVNVTTFVPSPLPTASALLSDYRCRQFTGWGTVDPVDRFSFESLTYAFFTVFDISTKDNWSAIQYNFMGLTGPYAVFFFLPCVVIGGYLIMALLVAILLVNFKQNEQDEDSAISVEHEAQETLDEEVIQCNGDNAKLRRVALEHLRLVLRALRCPKRRNKWKLND